MTRTGLSTRLVSLSSALFFVFLTSCIATTTTSRTSPGQAAIKNFETRTVGANSDDVFVAATEALFDLGYVIEHSDKESGIIMGEQKDDRKSERVLMTILGGYAAGASVRATTYNLSLLIRPVDETSTNVRIKTSVDGEPKLNKKAIDQVWLYIERQVLMESPPMVIPSETSPESVLESMSIPVGDGMVVESPYPAFSGPGDDFDNLGTLPNGTRINVLEKKDGWYRFSSEEFPSAWISPRFSESIEPEFQPTKPRPETAAATVKDETNRATITRRANVYPGPSGSYGMLGTISSATIISVIEEREKWIRFSSDGYPDAWVPKKYTDLAEERHFRRGAE